ncbi:unnamed protein product, partial [Mesorhabditis spiculigera]
MVDPDKVEQSSFGKHFVPDQDKDPHYPPKWNPEEALYMPCRDRQCVCPYFKGQVKDGECHLPSGHVLKRALRKEIRQLRDDERMEFEAAVNRLKRAGEYNRISRVHKYSGVHSGPGFTLWHREFLKRFELVIRREMNPEYGHYLGIPYWDSSMDSLIPDQRHTAMFTVELLGEIDDQNLVRTGPYANWTTMEGREAIERTISHDNEGEFLSRARVDWIIDNPDFRAVLAATMPIRTCPTYAALDDRFLEYSHDYVHFFVGGDMGHSHSSSNDIVFCLHHSMIDNIFELYRQKRQNETQRETVYHENDERCFPPWHNGDMFMPFLQPYTNKDALSNLYTRHMYEFAPRPACTKEKMECGSKFLFCHVFEGEPLCVAKVKLGGDCSGFEAPGVPVCYKGHCVRGVCQKMDPQKEAALKKIKEASRLARM